MPERPKTNCLLTPDGIGTIKGLKQSWYRVTVRSGHLKPSGSVTRAATHYLLFLFFFMIALPSAGYAAQIDTARPPSRGVIQSASELDYPPFAIVREDGSADGFSVELFRAAAQAVGFEVHFKVGPWNDIKQELIDGRLDALPLVSYSKDRDKKFDFTAPYIRMHGAIFVRKGYDRIHNESDLKDKEVIVMRGDTAQEYAVRHHLSDKLILTDSFETAMRELSAGKHDAVLAQHLMGLQIIKNLGITNVVSIQAFVNSNLKPTLNPLSGFEQKFCMAVHEGDKDLLSHLNEGLSLIIVNGDYDRLYDRWFGPILPKPAIPPAQLVKYVLLSILPLLILGGLFGLWYLRREVARKTHRLSDQIVVCQQTETSLVQTRDALQAILDAAPAGIVVADRNGNILHTSQFAVEMFGGPVKARIHGPGNDYTISSLDGSPVADDQLPITQALSGRTVYATELLVTRADGTHSVILTNATPLKKNDDEVWGAVTVFQDITKHKQISDALAVSEKKYRTLIETANSIIIRWDRQGIIRFINPFGARFFGYAMDELVGHDVMTIVPKVEASSGRDLEALVREIARHPDRNTYVPNENITRDGRIVWVAWTNKAIEDDQGNFREILAIGNDITELRNSEERLRASLTEKEVLLKEIHHRVKNNMQVISSLVSLQADALEDTAVRDILQDVIQRVHSMAMVHEKLYGSTDLGRVEFADYIESLMHYLWQAQGAAASHVQLHMDLKPVYLAINEAVPCGLILNELISNVLKHAFKGRNGGAVTVSLHEHNGATVLRVRDNGVGLPAQLDWRSIRTLGLRLVQLLAKQLEADVAVVSNNNGTEFSITLEEATE